MGHHIGAMLARSGGMRIRLAPATAGSIGIGELKGEGLAQFGAVQKEQSEGSLVSVNSLR